MFLWFIPEFADFTEFLFDLGKTPIYIGIHNNKNSNKDFKVAFSSRAILG